MSEINKAIEILKNGGIVIFPTDTAFGIGCRIDSEEAVERLFKIQKRPSSMAVPILVDSIKMTFEYLEPIPVDIYRLMNKYWPGALTIVFPCKISKVSSLIRGGGTTIGVRIPDNKTIREIIRGVRAPILGPSANFYEEKTPYKFEDINKDLINLVDFVIRGSTPKTTRDDVSTVIDCSVKPWKIIREGAVKVPASQRGEQNDIVLTIDTTSSEEVKVGLKIGNEKFSEKKKMDSKKREIVLDLVQKLLKEHKIELGDLTGIEVNPGPGSFTGIRVGISISNALGFALQIPVNGKIGGEVNPVYNK